MPFSIFIDGFGLEEDGFIFCVIRSTKMFVDSKGVESYMVINKPEKYQDIIFDDKVLRRYDPGKKQALKGFNLTYLQPD